MRVVYARICIGIAHTRTSCVCLCALPVHTLHTPYIHTHHVCVHGVCRCMCIFMHTPCTHTHSVCEHTVCMFIYTCTMLTHTPCVCAHVHVCICMCIFMNTPCMFMVYACLFMHAPCTYIHLSVCVHSVCNHHTYIYTKCTCMNGLCKWRVYRHRCRV